MPRYYAIADLHGRYDLLDKALHRITQDISEDEPVGGHKIILLGDYIDRGPESNLIIQRLMRESKDSPQHFICLQGNHEAMMIETIKTPLHPDWWTDNGGDKTLQSYGWGGPPYSGYAYEVVPKAHIDWMEGLPLFHETEKQVFVHAGIPQYNMNLPPSPNTFKGERLRQQMQWMIYNRGEAGGWRGKHVVHGHHQYQDGPHVWHGPHGGRTDLDVYAHATGRIVVGVFNDTKGSAVNYLEVFGEDYKPKGGKG